MDNNLDELKRKAQELGLAPKDLNNNQLPISSTSGYINGVPEALVKATIQQESGGNPKAISKSGAIGLMQLMPDTAKELGVDPFDPSQNVDGGTKYLKKQFDKYHDWEKALAAYNAGSKTVDKAIALGGDWKENMKHFQSPENFMQTRQYVENLSRHIDEPLENLKTKYSKLFSNGSTTDYSRVGIPDETKGTSDKNIDWVEKGALNSTLQNVWNSFKQGMDQTQQSSDFALQDDAQEIVDNYPDKKYDLDEKLKTGELDPGSYQEEIDKINSEAEAAFKRVKKLQEDINSNQQEIANEPVSKRYQVRNWLTQTQGSQADLWDKMKYSYPQVFGSSASLMGQQVAGTFGGKLFQSLASAGLGLVAPEPIASKIAAGTAIATALGLIINARRMESNSEVGDALKQNQDELLQNWQEMHPNQEPDEETLRQIRIQARQGKDKLFYENMALAIPDVVEALIMPQNKLGDLFTGLSKPLRKLESGIEEIQNASKFTRRASLIGRGYTDYIKEKAEEGFQYAASQRQHDTALNLGLYENQGLIKSILSDSYDTMSSLNYSPIGIVRNEDGKYANDPNFQFSEESGGALSLLSGAGITIPYSLIKDIKTYSKYTKELSGTKFDSADDKLLRLKTETLQKAFETDTVHHLIEGLKSVSQQKDVNGKPLLSEEDLQKEIGNIKIAYDKYQVISEYIDNLGGMLDSKETKQAKRVAKQDLFNAVVGLTKYTTEERDKISEKANLRIKSSNIKTFDLRDSESLVDIVEASIAELKSQIEKNPNEATLYDYKEQLSVLESLLPDLKTKKKIAEDEAQVNKTLPKALMGEPPLELFKINLDLIPTMVRKLLYQTKYDKLVKLKTLDEYKKHSEKRVQESKKKLASLENINRDLEEKAKPKPVEKESTPASGTIQLVTKNGIIEGTQERNITAKTELEDGAVEYTLEDGSKVTSNDGWQETNQSFKEDSPVEELNGVDHFLNLHRYNLAKEKIALQQRQAKTGEPIAHILQRLGDKAFPAHATERLLNKILGGLPQSEYHKYIKMVGALVQKDNFSTIVPLSGKTQLRGTKKTGAHIVLRVTDPDDSKSQYTLSHAYNPEFYEEYDGNTWKPVDFDSISFERFKQLFAFKYTETTPEAFEEFKINWRRAKTFNTQANIWVQQHIGDKKEIILPDNVFALDPKGSFDFIGKNEPIDADEFPEFKNRAVIFPSASGINTVNGIAYETSPDGLERGHYYVEAKLANGKIVWVRLFPKTAKLTGEEANKSVQNINDIIREVNDLDPNASKEELTPRFQELLRSIDFFVEPERGNLRVSFRINKAKNESKYSLKAVLVLDFGKGIDNPRQEIILKGDYKSFEELKSAIGGLYIQTIIGGTEQKFVVGNARIRKNLPYDTENTKIENPLKSLSSSTTRKIISNWSGNFMFFPENFNQEPQNQQAPASSLNEVDSFFGVSEMDDVLLENKKADIERRRQEELNNQLSDVINLKAAKTKEEVETALLKASGENTVSKALDNLAFLVNGIKEKFYNKDYSFTNDLASEIEKQQNKQVDKINAKYDAELAALEIKEIADAAAPEGKESKEVALTPEQELIYKSILEAGFSHEEALRIATESGTHTDEKDKVVTDLNTSDAFTIQEVSSFVKDKFGDAFTVQDIENLVSNSVINGTRVGTVLGNAIYIANGVSRTYAFHEAFHALFNNLLSSIQRRAYLNKIKEELGYSPKQLAEEITRLRSTSSQYDTLSDAEMANRVYEEKLADKYADWQNKRYEENRGFWRKLFQRIKNFINTLIKNPGIVHLFNRIDSGAFKNSGFKNIKTGEYNKIIPNTSPMQSRQIIYTIAASVINKDAKSIDNAFNGYAARFDLSIPQNTEFVKTLVDPVGSLLTMKRFHNKLVQNKDLIISEVSKFLSYQGYDENAVDFDEFTDDDSEVNWDKMSSEYDPSIRVGAQIKRLLATTLYNDTDIFGRPIKSALPWREVYNRMLPVLSISNTHPEDLMAKLKAMSAYSKQVSAFYNRLVELSGYDQSTDGVGVNGKNLLTQIKKAFELDKILYLQAVDKGNGYDIFIENKRDLNETKLATWKNDFLKVYFDIFADVKHKDRLLHDDLLRDLEYLSQSLQGKEVPDKTWKYINNTLKDRVFNVFNNLGIKLENEYLNFSFGESDENVKSREVLNNIYIITADDVKALRTSLAGNKTIKAKNIMEDQSVLIGKISDANASFDDYAFQKTYMDAENKKRYSYGLDSLLGTQKRAFKKLFKNKAAVEEFIQKNKEYWQHNPLLRKDPALVARIMKNFETGLAYDLRVNDRGVTSRRINMYDALMYQHALFMNQESSQYDGITSAPMVLNQFADKSQQMWGILPIFNYYDGKTKELTAEAKDDIWNLFVQEYKRNTGTYGKHLLAAQKGVWIHFPMFGDASNTKALQLLEAAKTDLNSIKDSVLEVIKETIDQEVQDHKKLLTDNRLSSKIAQKVIDQYTDLDGYLYNFTLNQTLIGVAINQLIAGDYGVAKNFEDYVKRISLVNAAGFSYSKNYDESDVHRVLYIDDVREYINGKTKEKISEEEYNKLKDKEGWDKIDTTDAQGYSGLDTYEDDLKRQGRYKEEMGEVLQKLRGEVIEDGEPVFPTLQELKDVGIDLIPSKQVVAGFTSTGETVFHKMAISYIIPQLCAKWNRKTQAFEAIPGKEDLFKKYQILNKKDSKGNRIDHLIPKTAAKLFFGANSVSLIDPKVTAESITDDFIYSIPNIYRRLQQENDSKEAGKVTASNQIENILGSELSDQEKLKKHSEINAKMRTQVFDFVRDVLVKDGDRAQADVILKKFRNIIEGSTPDNQMLEMLEEEAGKMKYDSNMPHLHSKFQALFLSTFKEVFRQKIPGVKFTAMSSQGYNILDPITKQYRSLQGMRHENGVTIPAEVAVSRKWADERGFKKGDEIILFRVPSQSYHSIGVAKIASILPDAYGDTIMAPADFVWLMGMDFDVDALYSYKKSYFKNDSGTIVEYGKELTPEDKFTGYIKDLFKNNTYFSTEFSENLKNNPEWRLLHPTESDDAISAEDKLYFFEIVTNPAFKTDEEARIRKEVLDKTLQRFNLPNTPEALEKSGLVSKSTLTNQLFDLKYQILSSSELQDAFSQPLAQKADENVQVGKENSDSTLRIGGSPLSIVRARQAAVQSKGLVGTAVNGNSFIQFATQVELQVSDDFALEFNNNKYNSFANTDKNTTRLKFDRASMTLGSIVDGMKKPFASYLNYDFNTVNKVMIMYGLQIPEKTIDHFFIQPVLKEITEELGKTQRLTNPPESTMYLRSRDKEDYIVNKIIKFVESKLPKDVHKDLGKNITDAELTEALALKQAGTLNEQYYRIQLKVLNAYVTLMSLDKDRGHVNSILATNRSLGSDVSDFYKVLEAVKALKPPMFGEPPYINILDKIRSNETLAQNISYVSGVLDAFKHYDISETDTGKKIFDAFKSVFKNDLSAQDILEIKRIIITSVQLAVLAKQDNIAGYKGLLLKGENSLASKVQRYMEETPNNYFTRLLKFQESKNKKYDLVGMDSRTQFTETVQDRLLDSFGSIFEKNPELAKDLFNYLLFKDSLMFRNNSFIKYIIPEMFLPLAKASQALNKIFAEDTINEEQLKEITGFNSAQLVDMTVENYIRHSINFRRLANRSIGSFTGLKYENGVFTVDVTSKKQSEYLSEEGKLVMPLWLKIDNVLFKRVKSTNTTAQYEAKTPYGNSERLPYALTPAQNEALERDLKDSTPEPEEGQAPPTETWEPPMLELSDLEANNALNNDAFTSISAKPEVKDGAIKVEIFKGFWTRAEIAKQTDKVFLFGDNTSDRTITHHVPTMTQAVIRGLSNAIGIDTKKDRGTNSTSYLTDSDFNWFKNHVDTQIQKAKASGKTIVIPADGIGTGKAMLKEKAPKLFEYLQQELSKLKNQSQNESVKPEEKTEEVTPKSKSPFVEISNDFNPSKTDLDAFDALMNADIKEYQSSQNKSNDAELSAEAQWAKYEGKLVAKYGKGIQDIWNSKDKEWRAYKINCL